MRMRIMINIWMRIRIMMKIWNLNKLMLQRKSSDEGELSTAGWKSKADAKAENDNNCDLVYLTISTFLYFIKRYWYINIWQCDLVYLTMSTFYISSVNIDTNNCDLVYLTISTFYISSSNIDTNNCDLVNLTMPIIFRKNWPIWYIWTKLWCGYLTIPIVLFVHDNW